MASRVSLIPGFERASLAVTHATIIPIRSAAILYLVIMTYVVLGMLNEVRPMWYYVLAAILFVLSQLDFFLLSKVICKVRCHLIFQCVLFSCHRNVRPLRLRVDSARLTGRSSQRYWRPPRSPCCTLRGEASRKVRIRLPTHSTCPPPGHCQRRALSTPPLTFHFVSAESWEEDIYYPR